MKTPLGHLTFCTNIFPGETWEEHFAALKENIPVIKQQLSPDRPFGIGLRLSNKASLQLNKQETFDEFKAWLDQNNCYVFTMNGFPYGNFHKQRVKDQVHAPDWTTNERLQYTLRLFRLLAALLPPGIDGGVSTSPLSYKYWPEVETSSASDIIEKSTWNILQVVQQLYAVYLSTGTMLHLDLEPEADGLIENSEEFINWFLSELVPIGTSVLQDKFSISEAEAEQAIRNHVRLCYDVCHFAVGYEDMEKVLERLKQAGISVGKWQLSSALKIDFDIAKENKDLLTEIKKFDEPVYLHQVVTKKKDGSKRQYRDLSDALNDNKALKDPEWRSHFHVPLFMSTYGLLGSTQSEVVDALRNQAKHPVTNHIEVETYTWDVLPDELKLPISESIVREMQWVNEQIAASVNLE